MAYLAKEYCISTGLGVSYKRLPSFDKALLDAGVGNYNLVRLSSILPAKCKEVPVNVLKYLVKEGSLLPVAYSTISSSQYGQMLVSTIGVGIPKDDENVGVIMEFSALDMTEEKALEILREMISEAFSERGWELKEMKCASKFAVVSAADAVFTTFACIAEW